MDTERLEPGGARGPALAPVVVAAVVGLALSGLLFALVRRTENAAFSAEFERRTMVPAAAL
ncbi:MAG TPA: hypothetical protein VJS65_09540, partial [Verrucomicrobiae bacterium]|nr:hypothetical protein [Verrucomicrobiae bacterium]